MTLDWFMMTDDWWLMTDDWSNWVSPCESQKRGVKWRKKLFLEQSGPQAVRWAAEWASTRKPKKTKVTSWAQDKGKLWYHWVKSKMFSKHFAEKSAFLYVLQTEMVRTFSFWIIRFLDCPDSSLIIFTVSCWFKQFLVYLDSFLIVWTVFRFSGQFLEYLDSFWIVRTVFGFFGYNRVLPTADKMVPLTLILAMFLFYHDAGGRAAKGPLTPLNHPTPRFLFVFQNISYGNPILIYFFLLFSSSRERVLNKKLINCLHKRFKRPKNQGFKRMNPKRPKHFAVETF